MHSNCPSTHSRSRWWELLPKGLELMSKCLLLVVGAGGAACTTPALQHPRGRMNEIRTDKGQHRAQLLQGRLLL